MSVERPEPAPLGATAGLVEAYLESAPIGFALLDRELRFVHVNERLAEINGVPAAAHVGLRPEVILPDVPVESYLPVLERALVGEPTEAVEMSGQTLGRPGVTRWWLESWSPVRGSAGEVVGVAAFVVEITDRKLAEARLRDAEARGLARAEALARLAAATSEVVTVRDLAAAVADQARDAVDAAFANVALIVAPGDRLRLFHAETIDGAIAARWRELPVSAPVPLADAVAGASPVFVSSPQDNARRYPALVADTEHAGLAATASLPLVDRDGNVLGAIGFGWDSPQQFGAAQRARLRTVAEIAAQSLQRAQLYEAERRGRERVALMADVTAAVSGTGSLADRLARLCELLVPRFADLAAAELLNHDGGPAPLAVTHADPAAFASLRALGDHATRAEAPHGGGRAAAVRAPRLLSDVPEATLAECARDPQTLALLSEIAPRSYVEVPLRAGTAPVGQLILVHTASGRRFDGEELAFACELGERAGLLLDNARLVEAEHEIASELQQRLLPSSLSTPSSVVAAARYRPADARLGVGGDWYDVIELADGKLAIAVGDVVGHGPRAAATMGQLRSAFAALAPAAAGPGELLDRLDAFAARTPDAQFGSVCAAVLDPRTYTLRYACAGHPPPLIVHPDASIETLEHGRSPLISAGYAARPEAVAGLPPGARLLVFTDGLVERRTASIDAGLQRLEDAARRHRELASEHLCDALLADMRDDEPTRDDTALLCIELLPPDTAGGEPQAQLRDLAAARR